jgi:hypothetical protein
LKIESLRIDSLRIDSLRTDSLGNVTEGLYAENIPREARNPRINMWRLRHLLYCKYMLMKLPIVLQVLRTEISFE